MLVCEVLQYVACKVNECRVWCSVNGPAHCITQMGSCCQAFVAEGPDYAALYGALRTAAGQLQHQAARLTAEQRLQLISAALSCCAAVTVVPEEAVVRFSDMIYYLTYTCALKVSCEPWPSLALASLVREDREET